MCRPHEKFDVRNEWIWIMARDITLSEEDEKNAMDTLMKRLPNFEKANLVRVDSQNKKL